MPRILHPQRGSRGGWTGLTDHPPCTRPGVLCADYINIVRPPPKHWNEHNGKTKQRTTPQGDQMNQDANTSQFTASKHRRLGGQYRAPNLTDRCERKLQAEEPMVRFEEVRMEAILANRRGDPTCPF
ncbi:hypothetical protein Pan181_23650 [Aeoliella mucimassa]|uniref:Uncharacterized protein n=1 Tax=Aeoliella mucimassa TaxID=2527972 RepID=A0A518AN89_9BACT|nr:hypothetical protein Pan181_23650 [Aeoliella mucimassa]